MNYKIDYIPPFARALKRLSKKYKSLKQDYSRLLEELKANPQAGADLGNGVHKVRLAIGSKNRGKSHGARVITYIYRIDEENGNITFALPLRQGRTRQHLCYRNKPTGCRSQGICRILTCIPSKALLPSILFVRSP